MYLVHLVRPQDGLPVASHSHSRFTSPLPPFYPSSKPETRRSHDQKTNRDGNCHGYDPPLPLSLPTGAFFGREEFLGSLGKEDKGGEEVHHGTVFRKICLGNGEVVGVVHGSAEDLVTRHVVVPRRGRGSASGDAVWVESEGARGGVCDVCGTAHQPGDSAWYQGLGSYCGQQNSLWYCNGQCSLARQPRKSRRGKMRWRNSIPGRRNVLCRSRSGLPYRPRICPLSPWSIQHHFDIRTHPGRKQCAVPKAP